MPEHAVPYSANAEEALLGSAMLNAVAMQVAVSEVDTLDFYSPNHRVIHTALQRMWRRGERSADPVLVEAEISAMGEAIEGLASQLIGMMANAPATSNADRYARTIQEKALARRICAAGVEITDLGYEADQLSGGLSEALSRTKAAIENLDLPMGTAQPSMNAEEFLAIPTSQDWLVPGLIERGDRIILTAAEGAGKSTLIRQLGVQLACGFHPWEGHFINPIRVLIIDVENSIPQVQRKLKQLQISARENFKPDNLYIEVRPEGLDLTSRHDARWLMERVAVTQPDLMTIGPIYKLHEADPADEQPARQVARVLDDIRARYGTSLLIEAHSPHGSNAKRPLRPFGASLWMRWPEFGYGLRPLKVDPTRFDFEEWRGPRDVRAWPKRLQRGGAWPWSAVPEQQRFL